MTKPIVVLSHCLADEACRYNGLAIRDPIVAALSLFVTFRPVCPEVAIGLGVPRDPIHLVADGDGVALVQPKTGLDVTETMRSFSAGYLAALGPVDGFLLKGRSPSCGISHVKIHAADGTRVERKGHGMFAQAVIDRHPHAAVEDEGRLGDFAIRDHFLTRVFSSARVRQVRSQAGLVRFHATYKLLLLAHSQAGMRALGRVVANAAERPFDEVRALYRDGLAVALARPARVSARARAFEHAISYAVDSLANSEKTHFLELLTRYRASQVPASEVTKRLRSWAERLEIASLADQALLDPYPEELLTLRDSGEASET